MGLSASCFSWGKSFLQVCLPSCFPLFSCPSESSSFFLQLGRVSFPWPTTTSRAKMNFALFVFHYCRAEAGAKHAPEIRRAFPKALPQSTWWLQHHRCGFYAPWAGRHFPLVPNISSFQPPGRSPEEPWVIGLSVAICMTCYATLSNQQLCTHDWCTGRRSLERCKYWWRRLGNSCVASAGG